MDNPPPSRDKGSSGYANSRLTSKPTKTRVPPSVRQYSPEIQESISNTWNAALSRLTSLLGNVPNLPAIDFVVVFCNTLARATLHPCFLDLVKWNVQNLNYPDDIVGKVAEFQHQTKKHGRLDTTIVKEFFNLAYDVETHFVGLSPVAKQMQVKLCSLEEWHLNPPLQVETTFESLQQYQQGEGLAKHGQILERWVRALLAIGTEGDLDLSEPQTVTSTDRIPIENAMNVERQLVKLIIQRFLMTQFYQKIKTIKATYIQSAPPNKLFGSDLVPILQYFNSLPELHASSVVPVLLSCVRDTLSVARGPDRHEVYTVLYDYLSTKTHVMPLFILHSIVDTIFASSALMMYKTAESSNCDVYIQEQEFLCKWLSLLAQPIRIPEAPLVDSRVFENRSFLHQTRYDLFEALNRSEASALRSDSFMSKVANDFLNCQLDFSTKIKELLTHFWRQCVECLGPPPCKIAMIVFGSASRSDMTPYSDVDWALYVQNQDHPETNEYVRTFLRLLEFFVIGMGETEGRTQNNVVGLHFDIKMNPIGGGTINPMVIGNFASLVERILKQGDVRRIMQQILCYSLVTSEVLCGSGPDGAELLDRAAINELNSELREQISSFMQDVPPNDDVSLFFNCASSKQITREFKWSDVFSIGRWAAEVGDHWPEVNEDTDEIDLKQLSRPLTLLSSTLALHHNISSIRHPMKVFWKLQENEISSIPIAFSSLCYYSWFFLNRLRFRKQREVFSQVDTVKRSELSDVEWENLVLIDKTVIQPWVKTMQQHLTNFENLSPGDPILNPALFEKIMRPYSDARAKKFRANVYAGEAVCTFCWTGNVDKLLECFKEPNFNVNCLNRRGQTPLYCAAHEGQTQIMIQLLNHPDIDVNQLIEPHFGTALHAAAFYEKIEAVALLLAKGGDPSIRNIYNFRPSDECPESSKDILTEFESLYDPIPVLQQKFPCLGYLNDQIPRPPKTTPAEEEPQWVSCTNYSLFAILHDFPDDDGWRPAIHNQEILWRKQIATILCPPTRLLQDPPPIFITSPTQGCQMLDPRISKSLFCELGARPPILLKNGDFNFQGCTNMLPGLHLVFPIEKDGVKMHIKVSPDAPGIGAAVDLLSTLIVGRVSPPSELWLWSCGGFEYPVLAIQTVEGVSFQDLVKKTNFEKLEFDNFSEQVVFSMISNPEDCLFQNVMLSGKTITIIDTERSFVPSLDHDTKVKNVFFCMNQMTQTVSRKTQEYLCYLNPGKVLYEWARKLEILNSLYTNIFRQMCEYYADPTAVKKNTPGARCLILPWIKQTTLNVIYDKLVFLQEAFEKREIQTHMDILYRLDFKLWHHYLQAFGKRDACERFLEAGGGRIKVVKGVFVTTTTLDEYLHNTMGLTTPAHTVVKTCTKSAVTLREAATAILGYQNTIQAIHEEISVEPSNVTDTFGSVAFCLQQRVINGVVWSDHMTSWQHSFFQRLGRESATYKRLSFKNSVITDDQLKGILVKNPHLLFLDITNCPALTAKTFQSLSRFPNLEKLVSSTSPASAIEYGMGLRERFIDWFAPRALSFITLQQCPSLTKFLWSSPALKHCDLSGCTKLTEVNLVAEGLTRLVLADCPALIDLKITSNQLPYMNLKACLQLQYFNHTTHGIIYDHVWIARSGDNVLEFMKQKKPMIFESRLTSISMKNEKFSTTEWEFLIKALEGNTTLASLDLGGCRGLQSVTESLLHKLSKIPSLSVLNLTGSDATKSERSMPSCLTINWDVALQKREAVDDRQNTPKRTSGPNPNSRTAAVTNATPHVGVIHSNSDGVMIQKRKPAETPPKKACLTNSLPSMPSINTSPTHLASKAQVPSPQGSSPSNVINVIDHNGSVAQPPGGKCLSCERIPWTLNSSGKGICCLQCEETKGQEHSEKCHTEQLSDSFVLIGN